MTTAERIDSLLSREGEEFIVGAYRALLGRNPDTVGFQNYLEQVHLGVDKLDLLESFLVSPEGQRVAAPWGPAFADYRLRYRPSPPTPLLKKFKRVPATVQRWIAPTLKSSGAKAKAADRPAAGAAEAGRPQHLGGATALVGPALWESPAAAAAQAEQLASLPPAAREVYRRFLSEIATTERMGPST